jgi:hypothetical protein
VIRILQRPAYSPPVSRETKTCTHWEEGVVLSHSAWEERVILNPVGQLLACPPVSMETSTSTHWEEGVILSLSGLGREVNSVAQRSAPPPVPCGTIAVSNVQLPDAQVKHHVQTRRSS